MIKIITHPLITAHKPKILLVTPPPLDEIHITKLDLAWGHPEATRKAKISASYSQAVRDIAAQHPETTLIDLWKAIMDVAIAKTPGFEPKSGVTLGDPDSGLRGYLEHLLPDGLHMSGEAYQIFFETVKAHLDSWEGQDGYVLPDWNVAPKLDE
jgi:lysophospholipase L1-like esterase